MQPKSSSAYLVDVVEALWPDATVTVTRSRFHRGHPSDIQFHVIPSLDRPRLLLPRRPRRATAAALMNYKASADRRAMLKIRVLARAAALGLADALPVRVSVSAGGDAITGHLASLLGHDVLVALYIGPPRAVQKPVLQLLTPDGQTVAFAKLGTNELTRCLISNEAAAIAGLAKQELEVLAVPDVLHFGEWREHSLMVQSAIAVGGSRAEVQRLLPVATAEIAGSMGIETALVESSRYLQRLRGRLASLPRQRHAELLSHTVERLLPTLAGSNVSLSFGAWHGDWATWNMTAVAGRLVAWDWEHFEGDVPVGFDAVHFDIQRLVVLERNKPSEAFAKVYEGAQDDLLSATLDNEARSVIVLLYAVELATRYLEQGESGVAGTPLSRIDTWLAGALDSGLRRLTSAR